jgi:hypothetical protein
MVRPENPHDQVEGVANALSRLIPSGHVRCITRDHSLGYHWGDGVYCTGYERTRIQGSASGRTMGRVW